MLLVSVLASILFFGGWHGPLPIFEWFGWAQQPNDSLSFTGYIAALVGCVNVLFKGVVGVAVMMWIRWTLPRLRIDQVMTTCLKYCTPIAAVMFAGVMLWQLFLPGGLVPGGRQGAISVREGWLEQAAEPPAEAVGVRRSVPQQLAGVAD